MGVYLRVDEGWQPGANTIAYYPFDSDQLDKTGNTSLSAQAGVQQSLGYRFTRDQNNFITINGTDVSNGRFVSFYANLIGRVGNFGAYLVGIPIGGVVYYYIENTRGFPYMYSIQYRSGQSSWGQSPGRYPVSNNTRYHFAYGIDTSNNITFYLNGVQQDSFQISGYAIDPCALGTNVDFVISNLILENKVRTSQEIADYYNQTKSNYGL